MLITEPLPLPSKIDWNRPIEWSSGEIATRDGFDAVSACAEWKNHTGDATVSVDDQTGRILGCEEEDYPHIRNIPLVGELGVNSIGEVWVKTEHDTVDVGGPYNVSDHPTPQEMARQHIPQPVTGRLPIQPTPLIQ